MISDVEAWSALIAVAGTLGAAALTHWWDERNASSRWRREESVRWQDARRVAYVSLVSQASLAYWTAVATPITGAGPNLTKTEVAILWAILTKADAAAAEIAMLSPDLTDVANKLVETARTASLQVILPRGQPPSPTRMRQPGATSLVPPATTF
jgi:hypothetical protein